MDVCETWMPDVVAPEAHQNDHSYLSELSGPTFDSICTNFMVDITCRTQKTNCQNWAVGACVGMGTCPGQYGIYIVPNV